MPRTGGRRWGPPAPRERLGRVSPAAAEGPPRGPGALPSGRRGQPRGAGLLSGRRRAAREEEPARRRGGDGGDPAGCRAPPPSRVGGPGAVREGGVREGAVPVPPAAPAGRGAGGAARLSPASRSSPAPGPGRQAEPEPSPAPQPAAAPHAAAAQSRLGALPRAVSRGGRAGGRGCRRRALPRGAGGEIRGGGARRAVRERRGAGRGLRSCAAQGKAAGKAGSCRRDSPARGEPPGREGGGWQRSVNKIWGGGGDSWFLLSCLDLVIPPCCYGCRSGGFRRRIALGGCTEREGLPLGNAEGAGEGTMVSVSRPP